MCQHGNRRVLRVNPHGDTTVIADALRRPAPELAQRPRLPLGRPLCFTDPPFGLPEVFDDPAKELPFSGVFAARDGRGRPGHRRRWRGPNGIAFSPDERYLYVGNWDLERQGRHALRARRGGRGSARDVFFDMTGVARRRRASTASRSTRDGHAVRLRPGRHLGALRRRASTAARSACPRPRTTSPGATTTAARSTSPR